MPEIEDYAVYNDRMRRSMWDKAFFMDKIPGAEVLVDYGCADGSLIRFLQGLFPAMRFVGFDIDPSMVAAARKQGIANAWFCSELPEVLDCLRSLGADAARTAVNYSSVLHEVFHYGTDPEPFRAFVRAVSPRYLVVRDMMYRSADPLAEVPAAAERRVRDLLPAWQVRDFERCWGSIRLRKNLVHLLLKYKYTENWDRECAENYFSYDDAMLAGLLDPDGRYRPIFLSRYILPWVRCDMQDRFGIDPGDECTTHFALILAAKEFCGSLSLNTGSGTGGAA